MQKMCDIVEIFMSAPHLGIKNIFISAPRASIKILLEKKLLDLPYPRQGVGRTMYHLPLERSSISSAKIEMSSSVYAYGSSPTSD